MTDQAPTQRTTAGEFREHDKQGLRRRWDEGKASGRAGALDIKRLIAEEREKLTAFKPNLKSYLLAAGYAGDDNAFDRSVRRVRSDGRPLLEPRDIDLKD